uniref:SUEL-type lectin domain-containing protein n=1 Tax=Sphaeramia orbicularis TaxID=375764 RepID=A0A672ZPA5_9TELE
QKKICNSSFSVLAAFCVLTRGDVFTHTVVTCDDLNNVDHIGCDTGVIIVHSALYGRTDSKTCSEGKAPQLLANTKCSQRGTLDVLKKRCDGKRVCELNTNVVRTSDPCPGIYKYLEVNYTCFTATRRVICENSQTYLQCDEGEVLIVYTANYGRRDHYTCSYQKPDIQIKNTNCLNPTSKIGESCNGKNSCTIKASNSVFGDPCVGTYKYLELVYKCQCK